MSIVSLQDAVVLVGRFPALSGVNLTVESGEILLLRGPNGAGKTTLLRLCAGLLRPYSGSAKVLGHDLHTARSSVRSSVGFLGHDNALYEELTVTENLRFVAQILRLEETTVVATLDQLDIAKRLHGVLVRHLSAGQKRRVALAVLVLCRPALWLLDEPHAGLDQSACELIDQLVVRASASGATVMIASHELDHSATLATRTITIVGGAVAQARVTREEHN